MGDGSKSCWIKKHNGSRTTHWGEERDWSGLDSTSIKMIKMKKGHRTSFKFNKIKNEMFVCVTGKVKAYFGDELIISKSEGNLQTYDLQPGDAIVVQSSCPYRLEALEDSTLIEVASGKGAPSRMHDDYGREIDYSSNHIDKLNKQWW